MFNIKKEVLAQLREEYPNGAKIVLLKMEDSYNQQPPRGTIGTVRHVDDTGTIIPSWDGHGSLGVVYGEDIAKKLTVVPDDKNNPFYTDKPDTKYTEILDLAVMLIEKGIPFEMKQCCDGWEIGYPEAYKGQSYLTDTQIVVKQHQFSRGAINKNLLQLCDFSHKDIPLTSLSEGEITADRALTLLQKHITEFPDVPKRYALTICQGEPEEQIVYAKLSKTQIEILHGDMIGKSSRYRLLTLENGETIEIGIVDALELVKESEEK